MLMRYPVPPFSESLLPCPGFRLVFTAAVGWLALGLGLLSQASAETAFPEVYNSEPDENAQPPAAEEALGMLDLPDGFTAMLFASEPEVQNPIAMAWDWRGRLWVAENYTYAERTMRFDLSLRDRVLIFEDTDWDGKADKRTVFTDSVQMLTSVETGRGGVWLMCPPRLLFVPDRDGDDVPDGEPEVVLDGFTVAQSNHHNFANGLRWGPDGWLYGRCGHSCPGRVGKPGTPDAERIPIEGGIWRYHPDREVFEGLTHGTTNPWGHDWDRHGELFFINTVNGHLWHGIPGAHFTESFGADSNPRVYERIDTHADHYHYDRTGSWSKSRDGTANQFGGGHAHIGMMIYQGDQWPERFHDRLFTINMHGRRTNVERLDREGSGYVGRHEPDIFLMGDAWYRGLDIRPGPDGSAFVIDWSDTGECHEHTGVHRTSGRIYRISYGMPEKPNLAQLATVNERSALLLTNPNPWMENQLRKRLVEGEERFENRDFLHLTRAVLWGEADSSIRLRALWRLKALEEHRPALRNLLKDESEHLRAWAIRLLVDESPIDTVVGPTEHAPPHPLDADVKETLVTMAESDPSGLVRLTLASSLQRIPIIHREKLGAALAARDEDADDHNLPEMVWYGISPLADTDPDGLLRIAEGSHWPDLLRWIARGLAEEVPEESSDSLDALLSLAAKADPELREPLLQGISDGLQGRRKASKPVGWEEFVAAQAESEISPSFQALVRELSALFGDGRAMEEIKGVVLDRGADYGIRRSALETLIENRPSDLREICESLLSDRLLNAIAVRGLVLFDDDELGQSIAKQYRRFTPESRPSVIEVLVSRPAWAAALLDEMEAGRVPKTDLSAFQARQIGTFGNEVLDGKLAATWGEVRESSEEKRRLIDDWARRLSEKTLAEADLVQGRQLYAGVCGACHVMYGQGGKIGPDLTGSNRSDLGYLLENIFDPSAVVSADYRMTILTLDDGRVLTGVVASETDRAVILRQATEEITVAKDEIEKREVSPLSMMPEGLLTALSDDQVRDLIAYLKHPVQVATK